jgi:hypothetical protein
MKKKKEKTIVIMFNCDRTTLALMDVCEEALRGSEVEVCLL